MTSPEPIARARSRLRFAIAGILVVALGAPAIVNAQGLVQGVQQGAREGNKAAGPVGGVLGVSTGVLGTGKNAPAPAPAPSDKGGAAKKDAKSAKAIKGQKQPAVLTQAGAPQLTAEQIVANSDANIERIKKELNLTPEQDKNWAGFNSAMHYLGHNGADRLNLRV